MYDDCESCEAAIFRGRKVCWICGGKVVQFKEADPEKRMALLKIMGRCPDVRVGDVWTKVWAWGASDIEIRGFKQQEGDLPWPMVETIVASDEGRLSLPKSIAGGLEPFEGSKVGGEVGLPAFIFGVLCQQGAGKSWMAMFSGPHQDIASHRSLSARGDIP
jgi:hypothetical protein